MFEVQDNSSIILSVIVIVLVVAIIVLAAYYKLSEDQNKGMKRINDSNAEMVKRLKIYAPSTNVGAPNSRSSAAAKKTVHFDKPLMDDVDDLYPSSEKYNEAPDVAVASKDVWTELSNNIKSNMKFKRT